MYGQETSIQIAPQRATLVLEHVSAAPDDEEEVDSASWLVVAYLIFDNGKRERATLRRCNTRAEAVETLGQIWSGLAAREPSLIHAG